MLETIKLNATGNLVKVAQYMTGYAEMKKATDAFDEAFQMYVMEWQAKNGLASDGIIGPASWTKMAENAPVCSTSKNTKSAYSCAVQILLGGLTVDGIYGSKTKKAVSAYQSANKLTVNGKCDANTWKALIVTGSASEGDSSEDSPSGAIVVNKKPVDYKQYDSKWGKIKYSTHTSSQTISNSGCGPTAMADIVATWWDKKITPKELCALSVEHGYRTYNSGTAWGFFEFVAKKYKASKFIQTTSIATLKSALQSGAYAVVSFGPSKWTSGGHFCCIWKWDGKYFYINDPASASSSRAKGTESEVKNARKQFFIFYNKDSGTTQPDTTKDVGEPTTTNPQDSVVGATGAAIIDISKWQGTINFDKLQKEVALVIARASCGSDKDIKIDEYAKAMNDRRIPFGVYCYSYAGDEAKAKDEAQKIVKYASQYKPLFYVMDAEESKITTASIKAFAKELRAQGVEKIGCYCAHNHYKDYNFDSVRDLWDFVWIPRYGKNDGSLAGSTKPAYKCDLWQFTSTGKIAGISGNVDMNVITGDGHDLAWFLGGAVAKDDVPASGQKVQVVNGNVNVRTLPSIDGEIIGVAYNGDELEYGGVTAENGWFSVVFNGQSAWISGKYGQLI